MVILNTDAAVLHMAMLHETATSEKFEGQSYGKQVLRRLMYSEWRQIDKRFILQIIVTITFQLIKRSLS